MQNISFPGSRIPDLDVTELLALLRSLENRQRRDLTEQLKAKAWSYQTGSEAILLDYLKGNISDPERSVNGSTVLERVWAISPESIRITLDTNPKQRPSIERRLKRSVKQLKDTLETLRQCTLDFLIQESLRDDPLLRTQVLERVLRERGVPKLYAENGTTQLSMLEEAEYRPLTLFARWRMEHQLFYRQAGHRSSELIPHFHRANQHLDRAYCLTKLRYLCEYENHRRILGLAEDLQDAFPAEQEDLIMRLVAVLAPDHPIFALYRQLLRFIRHLPPDLELLDRLEANYQTEKTQLAPLDRLVIVKLVIYFLNRGQVIRQPRLPAVHFHWGKKLLEDDIILQENTISPIEFIHIVYLAGPVGEIDFIEQFIADYQDKVPAIHRDIARDLSTAYLRFHQGRFIESIQILESAFPKNKTDLDYFQVPVKVLRLKSYLELCLSGESDTADDLTRNAIRDFDGYLGRYFSLPSGRFHPGFEAAYRAFLQFCRKLYGYRNYAYLDHRAEIETLITDIQAPESVVAREWLMDKAVGLRQ